MPAVFNKLGIFFEYPDNWLLEEHLVEGQTDNGAVERAEVVVSGPQTAFWHLSTHPANVDLESLCDEALAAMRAEYPGMEVEPANDLTSAGGWLDREQGNGKGEEGLIGFNANFICLDLTVTAWLRGFRACATSYLLLCQAEDRELSDVGPVFRAMWVSLLRGARARRQELGIGDV